MRSTVKNHSQLTKRCAFTLAEVLITLGIIGVVAAMTLPTLTAHYRKKVVETELQKSFAELSSILKRSEVDNENAYNWDWPVSHLGGSTEGTNNSKAFVEKYFAPYMKKVKVESGTQRTVYWSSGDVAWINSYINLNNGYILSSGAILYFFPVSGDNSSVNVATSNRKSTDFVLGKNLFTFTFIKKNNLVTLGLDTAKNWSCDYLNSNREKFISECKHDTGGGAHGINSATWCTYMIYCNGWKVPDDYPIKL